MIRKKYCITASTAILILLLSAPFSHSDDTLVADYGQTVAPKQTNEITMVAEEVIISVDDHVDKNIAVFPLRLAKVKCTFLFRNDTDKLIEAIVGFPGNEQSTASGYSWPITDFVTVIDGERLIINTKKEILKEYKKDNVQIFRNWYTWAMKFPPKSTVKVENTYRHFLGAPLGMGYDPLYLNYELSTGANWKGKIGKATIKVIYKNEEELRKRICEIKPKGWIRRKNEIIWDMKDIEPTEADNIKVCERNLGYPVAEGIPLLFKKK
ncbi:MAG: hypothetical protein AB1306_09765 [Nitrospirota bacterium]